MVDPDLNKSIVPGRRVPPDQTDHAALEASSYAYRRLPDLRPAELLVDREFAAQLPPSLSLAGITAAAREEGKLVEVLQVERDGKDVAWRIVGRGTTSVSSSDKLAQTYRRLG